MNHYAAAGILIQHLNDRLSEYYLNCTGILIQVDEKPQYRYEPASGTSCLNLHNTSSLRNLNAISVVDAGLKPESARSRSKQCSHPGRRA